jgi:SIR2-like domain
MKFSPDGPDIPTELIDAAIRGEVVFLCGAGVSQPCDLPNFKTLTSNVFARLGLSMSGAENFSFGQDRYEETLGSLSRRLADRKALYGAVAAELEADKAKKADPHGTILRLSRDFEGTPAIVTTNFDTLFERALHEATKEPVRDRSFAGAQVPAPGGPRFEGIIHLHGRLADAKLGLDESDLVLTSADYGDAYLRSGWAARFLYDLARTRTIVLVGYSAFGRTRSLHPQCLGSGSGTVSRPEADLRALRFRRSRCV